jgi:hypothetical protein
MIQVDFENTVSKNRLVRNDNNFSRTIVIYAACLAIVALLYQFYTEYIKDPLYGKIFLYGVCPVVIVLLAYVMYKKAVEKRLLGISSRVDLGTTKQIVVQYFRNKKWEIEYNEGNNLVATQPIDLRDEIQATIIFSEGYLLLNVIRNYYGNKTAMPLLFAETEVKKDLVWEIKTWGTDKEARLESE